MTSGADLNLQSRQGLTALMCACHVGCFESVELLLMYGADSSLRSHDGVTALDMAACQGHDDIVGLIQAIKLSQSSSTSPVLTVTEIATNVDNKACIKQWRKSSLIKQSSASTKHHKLESLLPPMNEQELQQFPF